MSRTPIRISRRWFALNIVGALLTACGMWLQQDAARPGLSALLLAAGVPLMALSMLTILRRARRARPRHD